MISEKGTDGFIRIKASKFSKDLAIDDHLLSQNSSLIDAVTRREVNREIKRVETKAIEYMNKKDLIKAVDFTKELIVAQTTVILCNKKTRNIIIKAGLDLSDVVIIVSDYIEDGTTYVVTDEETKKFFLDSIDTKYSNPWFRGNEI